MNDIEIATAYNSTFAIDGVSYSVDSFVVIVSSVLRINICVKKPAHRKSAKRYPLFSTVIPHEASAQCAICRTTTGALNEAGDSTSAALRWNDPFEWGGGMTG